MCTKYLGHGANTGGLQQHSISVDYLANHPWIVIAQGYPVVQRRAFNTVTGRYGPLRDTYDLALADCAELRYREKIVVAVHARGGLRNWADIANDPSPLAETEAAAIASDFAALQRAQFSPAAIERIAADLLAEAHGTSVVEDTAGLADRRCGLDRRTSSAQATTYGAVIFGRRNANSTRRKGIAGTREQIVGRAQ